MNPITIKLKNREEVEEFVRICNSYDFDIDVFQGNVSVDAKSILGVITLDLSRKTSVMPYTRTPEEAKDFARKINLFIER